MQTLLRCFRHWIRPALVCLGVMWLIPSQSAQSPKGAQVFSAAPMVVVVPQPKVRYLTWTYPTNIDADVSFEVWQNTNAIHPEVRLFSNSNSPAIDHTKWRLLTNVWNPPVRITTDLKHCFFIVRSINNRTGQVSDWAHK